MAIPRKGRAKRWCKVALLALLAIAVLAAVANYAIPWPAEGCWWGPNSLTACMCDNRWVHRIEFRNGKVHFYHGPKEGPGAGTYRRDADGTYTWHNGSFSRDAVVKVSLFRMKVVTDTNCYTAYRVPRAFLVLVRWWAGLW